jgi:2,4-dienoyl-CoA reductase-like NADH-dependent reductase (Old Yellow Enzyme family)
VYLLILLFVIAMSGLSSLFSPFKVDNLLTLKNRIVLAPLTRARSNDDRLPNDLMVEYYSQRAGAGLLITEATAISEQGYGWYHAPALYNKAQMNGWKKVVDAVHKKESAIYVQLWHMGRQGNPTFNPKGEVVSASAIGIESGTVRNSVGESVPYVVPRALDTSEIPGIVEDYKKGAALAKEAGFDGVEIHGANGYLIDQFLQSVSNKRTDKYGGSFENRFRFLKEIVEAVTEVFPPSRVGIRLSPNSAFGGMGSEDNFEMFEYVASQLQGKGLGYLHVLDGLGFGSHGKCKNVKLFDVKKNFLGPVIGNVGYTAETAEGAIGTGAADMIAFGRPFISNPDLPERFRNGWPLAPNPEFEGWYGYPNFGGKMYTDFPVYGVK